MPDRRRTAKPSSHPIVGVIMGSSSDWETMRHASELLNELGIEHECAVVSAHRTPDWLFEYAASAASRGLRVIIAGAGGAAHLPGMCASKSTLPVLGVPIVSTSSEPHSVKGLDSLLSIVQMPAGVPVGTLAIGKSGAINAGLLAAMILALSDPVIAKAVADYRHGQTARVLRERDPRKAAGKGPSRGGRQPKRT